MKQIKWLFAGLFISMSLVACSDVPSDDTKLGELETEEQVAACDDICADAKSYSVECMEDGTTITLSSSFEASTCASQCTSFLASVKDSCAVTVGDLRTLVTEEPTCDDSSARLASTFALAACVDAQ